MNAANLFRSVSPGLYFLIISLTPLRVSISFRQHLLHQFYGVRFLCSN